MYKHSFFTLVILTFAFALPDASWGQSQVPVEDFFRGDAFGAIKISPTGEYIAATLEFDDRTDLVILRRSDLQKVNYVRSEKGVFVSVFYWANPMKVLFSTGYKFGWSVKPVAGDNIWGVGTTGLGPSLLSNWSPVPKHASVNTLGRIITDKDRYEEITLINLLKNDDENVLVSARKRNAEFSDILKMNVETGAHEKIDQAPINNAEFLVDKKGIVRFATGSDVKNKSKTYYRGSDSAEWSLINDEALSGKALDPLVFGSDNNYVYIQSEEKSGPDAIYKFDTATKQSSLVLRDNNVDPAGLEMSPIDGSLYAVFFNDGYPRYEFVDDKNPYTIALKSLSVTFPDKFVSPVSFTKDGKLGVYLVYSDTQSAEYFLYDLDKRVLSSLAKTLKWLKPEMMSKQTPYELTMRDGLKVEVFLTTPNGAKPSAAMPLVVLPHGGPFGVFDEWGFDAEVQLLASRGYAVMQVNFRGSGNYGRAFLHAGYQQWGGTMQDDLTDATKWAISEGFADSKRICIYGSSYGGYAALMGVAKEPDLYQCAIGDIGVYDMNLMYKIGDIQRTEDGENFLKEALGSRNLDSASPVKLASQIKVPVLLLAGRKDDRAPIQHTIAMARALRRLNKPVEEKQYSDEEHGNYLFENRIDHANRVLEFLDRHIGAGSQKVKNN